jgi:hypothetical protein
MKAALATKCTVISSRGPHSTGDLLMKDYSDRLLGLADPDLSPRDLHALVERGTFGLVMTGHRQMPQ